MHMTTDDYLSPSQLGSMLTLIHLALKEVRVLAWSGGAEQAGDLADALCPIPLMIQKDRFDWQSLHDSLSKYQQKYPSKETGNYKRLFELIKESGK